MLMTMILMIVASSIRLEMKSQMLLKRLLIILNQLQKEKSLSKLPWINGLMLKKLRLID